MTTVDPLIGLRQALAGRYTIERELGRGATAIVYLANDLRHNRQVAIKVLNPELALAVRAKRFLREIQIAAQLNHPQILPVYDSGQADNLLYYVMPVVSESLRDRLHREKQFSLEDALAITREVADALGYAHQQGIVHRDIKPENILLSRGHAVVADFGIARALTAAAGQGLTDGIALGTPAYMSPEQGAGGGDLSAATDMYSLGCVAYEMLAGHPPFTGGTAREVIARHFLDPIPSLQAARPGVPPGVAAAIERAMAKVPKDRFSTAQAFGEALAKASRDTEPAAAFSQADHRKRPWLRGVYAAVVLVALAASALGWRMTIRTRNRNALAVMPFTNLTTDSTDQYFSEGMSDEITNSLGRTPNLRVVRITGTYARAHRDDTPQALGAALDVGRVLRGSVRRSGNELRVTVQLVNTRDNGLEWSDIYQKEPQDIFAVEDEISRSIVQQLQVKLGTNLSPARRSTENIEAHELYLKGRFFYSRRRREFYDRALEYFSAAVAKDSTYALAYSGLSDVYTQLYLLSYWPVEKAREQATAAALRAVALDSGLAEAHASLARVRNHFEWDWAGAEAEYRRAIELDPSYAPAHVWYGQQLCYLRRFEQGAREVLTAVRLDPLSPFIAQIAGLSLYLARRYDEAIEQERKALELEPGPTPHQWIGEVYLLQGRIPGAIAEFELAIKGFGGQGRADATTAKLVHAYWRSGDRSRALALANDLKQRTRQPNVLAWLHAGIGENDQAVAYLEQEYQEHGVGISILNAEPMWDGLRAHSGFRALLKKLNFPDSSQ